MARELIYQAKVELEGLTPLLMHKCSNLEKTPTSPETDYSNEWRGTAYIAADGKNNAICPAINIEAMLRDASKGQKIGKSPMTRLVPTGISVQEFEIDILSDGKTFTLDDIEKRNWIFRCPSVVQRKRIMRVRSCIPIGWTMNFTIDVTNSLLTKEIVKDLFVRSGYMAGLMDWRPGAPKPGKFGQFDLTKFEVI